ncbi:hypothetical protein BDF22DRAFT_745758 [Syncephalis plumigaleata]|nr:hypothetical protein BDF22DRAFT_745758 [Syncephalis plumigaleata]
MSMDKQLHLERTASINRGSYLRKLRRRFFPSLRTRKKSRQFIHESSIGYGMPRDINEKSGYSHHNHHHPIDTTMSKVVGVTKLASYSTGVDPPAYTVNPPPAFLLGPAKSPRKPPSFKAKSSRRRASPHSTTNRMQEMPKQQEKAEHLIVASKRETVAASRDVYLVS